MKIRPTEGPSGFFSSFAAGTVTVPSDENGIRVDGLSASGADVGLCDAIQDSFPRERSCPSDAGPELLRWAAAAPGRYLVEDDYDSEFRYRGKPVPSLQSADTAGRVIYIGTFSKSVAPPSGSALWCCRRGFLGPMKNCGFFSSTVSRIDQTILNEFLLSGAFERHLNRMRKGLPGKA